MSDNNQFTFSQQIEEFFSSGTVILFICEGTLEYPLLSISHNTEEILGFKPEYFLEREHGWTNRIHPDDRQAVYEKFNEVIKEGKSAINEYRFKRKDDSYIWLRQEIKLVNSKSKDDTVIYGSSFEITERKKTEKELKENKEEYQAVVEHIKDITYTLDEKGQFVFLNRQWSIHTGYSEEESYQKPLWEFAHEEDRKRLKLLINDLITGREYAFRKNFRFRKKEGDTFWSKCYARRITNNEGKIVVIGTIIDVSEEIALKEEKEKINKELEKRVKERSVELVREIEKRKEAELELQKRLKYEQAISKCSALLLKSMDPSSEVLNKSLEVLREVTDTDRVYIYKNIEEEGKLYLDLISEVTGESAQDDMLDEGARFSYEEVPWWYKQLSDNKIINRKVNELPSEERKILEDQNVKSVLVIPIIVNGQWYGYIGFADTHDKRSWKESEIGLLKTASDIISAYQKRKSIEESLVQQRNYTETILDSLPSIYILMNENFEFVQWNKNLENYTGLNREDLKKKTTFDLVASEDHEELKKATQRMIESNHAGVELRLKNESGEYAPYFWRGYFIELNNQKYFLSVGVDITKQKNTQQELMDEKRLNEALIESLPGIFYMLDRDGNYVRWNRNFVKELGYSPEEIRIMTPADFYNEKEEKRILKAVEDVYSEGEQEIEAKITTKDGKEVPYFLTGKVFVQNNEEYLVGVGHDISEQIEARKRLKRSEELFRSLFLEAPAAIAMVDPENKIQGINKSFENLFGYSEGEAKGKNINSLIIPEESKGEVSNMFESGSLRNSFQQEGKRLNKNGDVIDVFVAGIPVHVDEEPLAGFGMYIDITDQKKYEQEIYSSLKEKHVLLQEIHHRVKNNLAVISGLLQLQIYETDDPKIRETLKESEGRIQTMALIHEKLYSSKSLSKISCKSYIGDLADTLKVTNDLDKDIEIVKDIEDDIELNINLAVPFALLVNEVVTNSFKHAFKEKPDGKIIIQLYQKDEVIHGMIRDNGIGLPEGFDIEKKESLGMTLIRNFIRQLEADGEMGSDDGAYIRFSFKKEEVHGSSSSGLLNSMS